MSRRFTLAAFWRARAGVAAVEFALILPMMILLLFGSVEIINLVQANRRVANVGVSLADVISRDTEITNAEMTGIWSAVEPLMFPDDVDGLSVRVTSISIQSSSTARVVWSDRIGTVYSTLAPNSSVSGMPSGMMAAGTSVIRVETTYDYRPILGFFFMEDGFRIRRDLNAGGEPTGMTLSHVAYRRSRLVDPIPRVS